MFLFVGGGRLYFRCSFSTGLALSNCDDFFAVGMVCCLGGAWVVLAVVWLIRSGWSGCGWFCLLGDGEMRVRHGFTHLPERRGWRWSADPLFFTAFDLLASTLALLDAGVGAPAAILTPWQAKAMDWQI